MNLIFAEQYFPLVLHQIFTVHYAENHKIIATYCPQTLLLHRNNTLDYYFTLNNTAYCQIWNTKKYLMKANCMSFTLTCTNNILCYMYVRNKFETL